MSDAPKKEKVVDLAKDTKASFPMDPRDAHMKPTGTGKTPEESYMEWLLSPSDKNDKFVP